ncbi:hypothetical protein WICMUC_001814 [Wickerhamomyces mucosus]|uniref:Putative transcription factor kapC n=1 Tax=Wickerhamomyces mucosus TaxID=1378264 RepID=A0A9P8PRT4_9ASCO|nr:hypothetical protein WICMUC_001814 [Wickerhamomyces mucosus]
MRSIENQKKIMSNQWQNNEDRKLDEQIDPSFSRQQDDTLNQLNQQNQPQELTQLQQQQPSQPSQPSQPPQQQQQAPNSSEAPLSDSTFNATAVAAAASNESATQQLALQQQQQQQQQQLLTHQQIQQPQPPQPPQVHLPPHHQLENKPNEEGQPQLTRNGRVLTNTKRAAQNRMAQRAFRQRKEAQYRDLELRANETDKLRVAIEQLQEENRQFRDHILTLQAKLIEQSDTPTPPAVFVPRKKEE